VPVVVADAARAAVPVYLNGLGNVTAFYTVTIKSRVDGQIVSVDFKEGDFVNQGQVLVEIDPRPFQVQLESALAAQAHDLALLENAKVDLERYRQLVATDAAPKQQLDTQTALIAQDEATVKQDAATIDNARLQLTYAKITAPISGVLGLRLADPGNIVHASDNTGMVVITQLQPISVLFTIPEDSLPMVTRKIRAGAKLRVDAFNRDHSRLLASGTLQTIDNQIDNTTGTSKLKAVFDNADFALFPQQFVNIRLLVDTLNDQFVVPNVAVQNGQQGNFVYVVDQRSHVHLKPVKVGITTDSSSQILDGVTDGDQVVVDGTDRLVEDAQVRVRDPEEVKNLASADAPARSASPPAGDRAAGASGDRPKGAGRRGQRGDATE
jgi:multidrug efflux system membrane fusion protein